MTAENIDISELSSIQSFAGARLNGQPNRAGSVVVRADRLVVRDDGAIDTFIGGRGSGGTLSVAAREIELRNGGRIDSSSQGPGEGGRVTVTAGRLLVVGGDPESHDRDHRRQLRGGYRRDRDGGGRRDRASRRRRNSQRHIQVGRRRRGHGERPSACSWMGRARKPKRCSPGPASSATPPRSSSSRASGFPRPATPGG